ncbi:MAG: hypothetical protein ACREOZ_03070, partial [Gloeomargaritales cyanobacterium]
MKKICLIITLLFVSQFCHAQNTTIITGTVIDSDSQVWSKASWKATLLIPGGGGRAHYISGGVVPDSVSGILDANGVFSGASLPNNTKIVPFGTVWSISMCSLTSAQCTTYLPLLIQGSTLDLGSSLSPLTPGPRIQASSLIYAYNTAEIINQTNGNGYTNTISNASFLWDGSAWVPTSGGTGNVLPGTTPLLAVYPTTSSTVGPANTTIGGVAARIQGILNPDLFATGAGNNGISNTFASTYCVTNCFIKVPPNSTDTESNPIPPSGSVLLDQRSNQSHFIYNNVGQVVVCGSDILFYTPNCDEVYFTGANTNQGLYAHHMKVSGPGYNLGNGASFATGWTTYIEKPFEDEFWQRGIKQHEAGFIHAHGIGDADGTVLYVDSDGGRTDASAEGVLGASFHAIETTTYNHANIVSGGTTGSTNIITTNTSGQNIYTDGGFLLYVAQSGST